MARRKRRKGYNRGRSWKLDRMRESKEKHEKRYKKKKRGLAYASKATRRRVAKKGGRSKRR